MKPYYFDEQSAFKEQVLNAAMLFASEQKVEAFWLTHRLGMDEKTSKQVILQLEKMAIISQKNESFFILISDLEELMEIFSDYLPGIDANLFYLKYVDIIELEKAGSIAQNPVQPKTKKKDFLSRLFS